MSSTFFLRYEGERDTHKHLLWHRAFLWVWHLWCLSWKVFKCNSQTQTASSNMTLKLAQQNGRIAIVSILADLNFQQVQPNRAASVAVDSRITILAWFFIWSLISVHYLQIISLQTHSSKSNSSEVTQVPVNVLRGHGRVWEVRESKLFRHQTTNGKEREVKWPQRRSGWTSVRQNTAPNQSQMVGCYYVPEINYRQDLLTVTALHTVQQRIQQKPAGDYAPKLIC